MFPDRVARLVTIAGLAAVLLPAGAHAATATDTVTVGVDTTAAVRTTERARFSRDLSTDRPDVTESAYTVERGRIQVEMDLVNASAAKASGTRSSSFGVAGVNAKIGLHARVDLQVVTEWWSQVTEHASGSARETRVGFGDLTVRSKINLWGNDGGRTALALMPFVTLPTATGGLGSGAVEGGLIVPLAIELGAGFGMGLMSEVDLVQRENGSAYGADFVQSATIARDLFGPIGAYVEAVGILPTGARGVWEATGNAGITYGVTPDMQFDLGANLGLTAGVDRVIAFVGFSFRR